MPDDSTVTVDADNVRVKPTDGELEILQVLWRHGPSTVRFVNELLNQKKEVGYTTTLKIMQLMLQKGILNRDAGKRTHVYEAAVKETETVGVMLDRFLDNVFGGSASKLVMQALGNRKASAEEIREIKDFLNKMEKNFATD